ncbi:hypothetical protein [Haloglomus halophilum]|uniref:hypothetical protein n=1 Tax=Haloglomus halophilum TaxID=2962672 RepID=UPI0020C9A3DA|nr:hypothetical protein [Haloglomus halophilum]
MTDEPAWADGPEATHYDGDVTLTGEPGPVVVEDPADTFVRADAVTGDLKLVDAEYVFTDTPVEGGTTVAQPELRVAGDVEDGYVDRRGVEGDAVIADAEDVFVAGRAAGTLDVTGAESVFRASGDPPDTSGFESFVGWRRSGNVENPDGIVLVGARHDVTVSGVTGDLTVYVVGHDHRVRVDGPRGTDADVTVRFVGYENTVRLGPYLTVADTVEGGYDNVVDADPFPVNDLIETSHDEAYGVASFGRTKVTYQAEATEDWCPNCGAEADAIIERHQEEVFLLFGIPVKTYDEGGVSYECEECAVRNDTALSESERRSVLR